MKINNLINNLEVRQKIKEAVESAVRSQHTILEEREHLKDITNTMKDKYDIPTAEFNSLIKAAMDKDKLSEQHSKIESTLEAINLLYSDVEVSRDF